MFLRRINQRVVADDKTPEGQVLSQPTAPFREDRVRNAIKEWSSRIGLKVFQDKLGNLWLNVSEANDLQSVDTLFVAHMDHPGIVVHDFEEIDNQLFAVGGWLGGGSTGITGWPVRLFSTSEQGLAEKIELSGKVKVETIRKGKKGSRPARVRIELSETDKSLSDLRALMPWGACLWFPELKDSFAQVGAYWYVRSADDLFLVASLLRAAEEQPPDKNVAILFARSEEKGEMGSYFAAADTPLTRSARIVSVDVEPVYSFKDIGHGVSVKTLTGADDGGEALTHSIKELADINGITVNEGELKEYKTDVRAFDDMGFTTTCISIPVFNMHNKSKADDSSPKLEVLSDTDRSALVRLLTELFKGKNDALPTEERS